MNHRSKTRAAFAALVVAALLLAGCVSGVPVAVSNKSTAQLEHVVVSGEGFSVKVGSVAPGATETVRIRPRGETSVKVTFQLGGQRYSAITEGTIANDDVNTVEAVVNEDLSITLTTPLR